MIPPIIIISTRVCLYRQQLNTPTLHASRSSFCFHLKFISVCVEWCQAGWQPAVFQPLGSSSPRWGTAFTGPTTCRRDLCGSGTRGCSCTEPLGLVIAILSLPWHCLWNKTICHLVWEPQTCIVLTGARWEINNKYFSVNYIFTVGFPKISSAAM